MRTTYRPLMVSAAMSVLAATSLAAEEQGETLEEITVTGTRLQSGFTQPTPVTIIGEELLESRAKNSIADSLNEIPAFRPSSGPGQGTFRIQGSNGAQLLDLRGLGTARTLTLIDSRRHVPSFATGSVDTNLVPTNLIERVDVVTGGASAAYGSDAVAGVVNIVLKNRIEGIEAGVSGGVSNYGDAGSVALNLAAGIDFAGGKGHLIAGLDLSEERGTGTIYSRPWGRNEPGVVALTARPAGTPANLVTEGVQMANRYPGSIIIAGPLAGQAISPTGQLFSYFGPLSGAADTIGGSAYGNAQASNQRFRNPTDRAVFLGRASYEFGKTEVYAEANLAHFEVGTQTIYPFRIPITVLRNNPFLPAAVTSRMDALSLPAIVIGRNFPEIGPVSALATTNTAQLTLGAKGDLAGSWKWDTYVQYGESRFSNDQFNLINTPNLVAGSYVVQTANGPACGPITTNPNAAALNAAQIAIIDPGCVPLNLFGAGNMSAAGASYFRGRQDQQQRYEQWAGGFNVTGEPFKLPAGDVAVAVGLEGRRDSYEQDQDRYSAVGALAPIQGNAYAGKVNVWEGYAEIGVPLIKDQTLFRALDLNGAVRRTDYSTSGNVTTWKAGLTWDVNDMFRLRTTYSQDIRAPNISELFAVSGDIATPHTNVVTNGTGTGITRNIGNLNLQPEVAKTFTVGLVFQGTGRLSGLRTSVDYYRITIDDVIAATPLAIAQQQAFGLNNPFYRTLFDINTSPLGYSVYRNIPLNQNQQLLKGEDYEVSYSAPEGLFGVPGRFDLRLLATHTPVLTTTDVTGTARKLAGYDKPKWNGNATLSYRNKGFSGYLQTRFFDGQRLDITRFGPDEAGYNPALPTSINDNQGPGAAYFNLGAAYKFTLYGQEMQVSGVADNVFNKAPPVIAFPMLSNTFVPYDMVGRYYRLALKIKY